MIFKGFPITLDGYVSLPRGNVSFCRIYKNMLVSQWFSKDSQAVAMVWTGEEDPYVFLATNENVGFPIVFLGFR